ncbi:MAG: hypothetical protein ACO3I1_04015 [Burkholderiales bacterium]
MKIDKHIPLPPRIANRVKIGPLPLEKLKIGDSILVPCKAEEQDRVLHSLRVRLVRFSQKDPDFKFSSSKVEGGVRAWRV